MSEHTTECINQHECAAADCKGAPLQARGLSYTYPRASHPAFSDIDLDVEAGCMVAILGNNGAGKSTLLDLLAGITSPQSGNVTVLSKDLAHLTRREAAKHIAYVTQQQTIPHLTVYDEILLGRKPHITWGISEHDREVVAGAIERLGLQEHVHRYCDELSGGERQKVFIARALAQEAQVLVLDEPTSALDPKNQTEVLGAIRKITHREGLATILVLHNLNLALRFCDRFFLLRNGRVVASGDGSVVTSETLTETYDAPFVIAEFDGIRIALPQIEGV